MLDLFAGCGGLTDGFMQTKCFDDIAAVEWKEPQVRTLRHRLKTKWGENDADERVLHYDVQKETELFNGWSDDPDYGSSKGLDYYVKKQAESILLSEDHHVRRILWPGVSAMKTEWRMIIEISCLNITCLL